MNCTWTDLEPYFCIECKQSFILSITLLVISIFLFRYLCNHHVLFNLGLVVVKWNRVSNGLEQSGRSLDSECAFYDNTENSEGRHEIQKDDISCGFQEIWSWLMSWIPDLSLWVKKLIIMGILVILTLVCVVVIVQCCIKCGSSLISKLI